MMASNPQKIILGEWNGCNAFRKTVVLPEGGITATSVL